VTVQRRRDRIWPFIAKLFADKGYAGRHVADATPINVEVVTGPKNQLGFIGQKRRWVVERTIAWINVNRRLAKDYERHASMSLAFVVLAAAFVLLQRLG
jgi:putative transposase